MVIIMKTKERELLRRISSHSESRIPAHFIKEIQELLAQPEQEEAPVATKLEGHQFTAFHVSEGDFKKLQKLPTGTKIYTAPPKREHLSDEAICEILLKKEWRGFVELVRIIEKAHGIGGGE